MTALRVGFAPHPLDRAAAPPSGVIAALRGDAPGARVAVAGDLGLDAPSRDPADWRLPPVPDSDADDAARRRGTEADAPSARR